MIDSSMILSSPLGIGDLLMGCVMFVLFVVAAGLHIPCRSEWRQFRMAVHLVSLACLLLSVNYIASIFFEPVAYSPFGDKLIPLVTITGAMFQALMFTMTAVVLVLPDAVRWHQVARHLVLLAVVTVGCLGGYALWSAWRGILVAVAGLFCLGYMAYLTFFFRRSFRQAVSYLETVYDDDMLPRLRWVRVFFCGALAVGLMALLSAAFPSMLVYTLFNVSVPVYYCYAVVCLMNYVVTSTYVVRASGPADGAEMQQTTPVQPEADDAKHLQVVREALDKWVEERGYAQGDMTVEEIIDQLGVSRQDFMAYFKQVLGTQFRTWRRHLRIKDAMRLIDADPDISVGEIIESVGYSDRSNFHKHFQDVAGVSLKEYREAARKGEGDNDEPIAR